MCCRTRIQPNHNEFAKHEPKTAAFEITVAKPAPKLAAFESSVAKREPRPFAANLGRPFAKQRPAHTPYVFLVAKPKRTALRFASEFAKKSKFLAATTTAVTHVETAVACSVDAFVV